MAILKEDGSLDIERINSLPREERQKMIGSFTRAQFQEYVSSIPPNEGYTHTRSIRVDKPSGVDAHEFMKQMRVKYGKKQ